MLFRFERDGELLGLDVTKTDGHGNGVTELADGGVLIAICL